MRHSDTPLMVSHLSHFALFWDCLKATRPRQEEPPVLPLEDGSEPARGAG